MRSFVECSNLQTSDELTSDPTSLAFLPPLPVSEHSIAPMDPPNPITKQPGRSDPYLVLKLGKTTINERKDYVEDVSDVDFFRVGWQAGRC